MSIGLGPVPKIHSHVLLGTPDVAGGFHSVVREQIAHEKLHLPCVLSVCGTRESLTSSRILGPGTISLASRLEHRTQQCPMLLAVQNISIAPVHLIKMNFMWWSMFPSAPRNVIIFRAGRKQQSSLELSFLRTVDVTHHL